MTMEIQVPEVTKILNDYDIIFSSGMVLPITVDLALGDSVTVTENIMSFHITSKPSSNDPSVMLPAEETTIFLRHVISIQHRRREVVELTKEQRSEWHKTWQELTAHPTVM